MLGMKWTEHTGNEGKKSKVSDILVSGAGQAI